MLPIGQILMDLSTTILATLVGLLAYRKLPAFYRILFFQALAYLIIDSYASTYTHNAKSYNIETVIEVSLLFLASIIYFKMKSSRFLLSGLFLIFLSLFAFDIYHFPNDLAYHAYIVAGIAITGIYLSILFFHFLGKKDNYSTPALVLTCLGIVIYFACSIPYLSMMYDLQEQSPQSNKDLFNIIIVALSRVRYLLVALAFLMYWKPFRFRLQNKPHS